MSSVQEVLPERASGILRRTLGLTILGGGTLPDCHQVSLRWGGGGTTKHLGRYMHMPTEFFRNHSVKCSRPPNKE